MRTHLRKHRWYYLAFLVLLAVTGLWAIWAARGGADPISRTNFERIKAGMTRAEVEGILGRPPTVGVGLDGNVFWIWVRTPSFFTPLAQVQIQVADERVGKAIWGEVPWHVHVGDRIIGLFRR